MRFKQLGMVVSNNIFLPFPEKSGPFKLMFPCACVGVFFSTFFFSLIDYLISSDWRPVRGKGRGARQRVYWR
jgi:hypothetical protein